MQYLIELPLINELVQKLFNCSDHPTLPIDCNAWHLLNRFSQSLVTR